MTRRFSLVGGIVVVALVAALVVRAAVIEHPDPVVIVQWSNSHPMRKGLLPDMAESFNDQHHKTASGRPIKVVVVSCDSAAQADDLVSRVNGSGRAEHGCGTATTPAPEPTIVTPQSDDWLVDINHRAGRDVVDPSSTRSIADTWLGIVTYRDMAKCLGWPGKPLGYADILALRADPQGWASHPDCAQYSWGKRPLLAFTNPTTSTSGRNVLVSLYSIAAHKPLADLTVADVERPDVVDYVTNFQQLVDHYMPATIPLNTKISQGERYGHFFLMPEDNLVNLFLGNEKIIAADGTERPAQSVHDLVMIYPKEGSVLNSNPAGLVQASWVTSEQSEAAGSWVDYLRSEKPQSAFGAAGFRPPHDTNFSVDAQQFEQWGLQAKAPSAVIEPGDLKPDVLDRIIDSWAAVKNPAIVTLVVDVSGSMAGDRLAEVKEGLVNLVSSIASSANPGHSDEVGLVTFADTVQTEIAPRPLAESGYEITDTINAMTADGGTALYDAIVKGVALSDRAAPGDDRAKRSVVVLSDGQSNDGSCLTSLVKMTSTSEADVDYCGKQGDAAPVPVDDIIGERLALPHDHDVQIFFIGFGESDVGIGRILAQATGAEYVGQVDDDLANVIEKLSGYF